MTKEIKLELTEDEYECLTNAIILFENDEYTTPLGKTVCNTLWEKITNQNSEK